MYIPTRRLNDLPDDALRIIAEYLKGNKDDWDAMRGTSRPMREFIEKCITTAILTTSSPTLESFPKGGRVKHIVISKHVGIPLDGDYTTGIKEEATAMSMLSGLTLLDVEKVTMNVDRVSGKLIVAMARAFPNLKNLTLDVLGLDALPQRSLFESLLVMENLQKLEVDYPYGDRILPPGAIMNISTLNLRAHIAN